MFQLRYPHRILKRILLPNGRRPRRVKAGAFKGICFALDLTNAVPLGRTVAFHLTGQDVVSEKGECKPAREIKTKPGPMILTSSVILVGGALYVRRMQRTFADVR
jgi:hypothetical protein